MINCVYIHIPFCERKCKYCSFCSLELKDSLSSLKEEYLAALEIEIKHYYRKENLKTLYLGGGTPSLLEISEIEKILGCFNFDSNCETTIEINPNSITLNKLKALKSIGINRFSLGVQSFFDKTLKEIGRLHSKKQIIETLENFNKANIDNYSIDLIYGLPNQTLKSWVETLQYTQLLRKNSIDIKHISLYGLSIDKGSYYYRFPPQNLPDLDLQARMQEMAFEILSKDYIHYEFSNFAKEEKYFSKHNLSYWQRKKYYGFGLSASGFVFNEPQESHLPQDFISKSKRYTNTSNLKKYIKNPIVKDHEYLTINQEIEEEIFLNLRTNKGLDINKVNKEYGVDVFQKYRTQFAKFISLGFLEQQDNIIKFTKKGILVSNEILCEFIEI